jgi:ABC-type phosphate transport system ATPase subunit
MAANNSINVVFNGRIFENGAIIPAIQKTIDKTSLFGSDLIASRTPVRTGMLQEGWTPLSQSIFNNVPYGIFQEDGTRRIKARNMVKNSLQDIEEYWIDLLKKAMN